MSKTLSRAASLCALVFASPVPSLLAQAADAPKHILAAPAELKWGPAPPFLPKGATFVLLSGDPAEAAPFVLRVRMPAGYRIAAHWHPTNENVTVLSGTLSVGMGDKFDRTALKSMPAGTYALMPAETRHFVMAKTAVTIQVHGIGPFTLNYVDAADDPRKQPPPKP
jgi:quercetin dioxygenase-like cupin family protein